MSVFETAVVVLRAFLLPRTVIMAENLALRHQIDSAGRRSGDHGASSASLPAQIESEAFAPVSFV